MAGCSRKQYAIMMSAGEEGKKLASEMGGMEQDKFDEAFSALLGSGSYKPQEGEQAYSRDTDEDYGDFDADSDDDYGFDDEEDDYGTALKEMQEAGVNFDDPREVMEYLGATMGYDREDQVRMMGMMGFSDDDIERLRNPGGNKSVTVHNKDGSSEQKKLGDNYHESIKNIMQDKNVDSIDDFGDDYEDDDGLEFTEAEERQIDKYAEHYGADANAMKKSIYAKAQEYMKGDNMGDEEAYDKAMEEILDEVANGEYNREMKKAQEQNAAMSETYSDDDFNKGQTVDAPEKGEGWKKTKMASGTLYEGPNGERYMDNGSALYGNKNPYAEQKKQMDEAANDFNKKMNNYNATVEKNQAEMRQRLGLVDNKTYHFEESGAGEEPDDLTLDGIKYMIDHNLEGEPNRENVDRFLKGAGLNDDNARAEVLDKLGYKDEGNQETYTSEDLGYRPNSKGGFDVIQKDTDERDERVIKSFNTKNGARAYINVLLKKQNNAAQEEYQGKVGSRMRDYVYEQQNPEYGEDNRRHNPTPNQKKVEMADRAKAAEPYKAPHEYEDFEDARFYPTKSRMEGNRWVGRYYGIGEGMGLKDWNDERVKHVEDYNNTSIFQLPDGYYSINPNITSMSFKTVDALKNYLDRKNPEEHKYGVYWDGDIQRDYRLKDENGKEYGAEGPDAYKAARAKKPEPQPTGTQTIQIRENMNPRDKEIAEYINKLSEDESYWLFDALRSKFRR